MRTITYDDALRALNEAVKSKGYDYVDANAAKGYTCKNVETGLDGVVRPSCIVGTALAWLGVPVEWMRDMCPSGGVGTIAARLRGTGIADINPDAVRLLSQVQFEQDRRSPWGKAVAIGHLGTDEFLRLNLNQDAE